MLQIGGQIGCLHEPVEFPMAFLPWTMLHDGTCGWMHGIKRLISVFILAAAADSFDLLFLQYFFLRENPSTSITLL